MAKARSFHFTAKNLGRERYLTYIMGEGMDVDEDVLDFCEEHELEEIVKIIYEEDDEYDYLNYDVTGKTSLEKYTQGVVDKEKVFKLLRNVSLGMISIKEYAIPLSYVLLNKSFMYVDKETLKITFLYLPVEGEASVSSEFKSFVRQFIAGLKFNVEEDLSYVGQLLTYINGDGFNLRGLIGLVEALMKDAGIQFEAGADIATDDGAEVVDSVDPAVLAEEEKSAMDFMKDLQVVDDKLPEIGDDEDEAEAETDTASESAEEPEAPAVESIKEEPPVEDTPNSEETPAAAEQQPEKPIEMKPKKAESISDIKARLEQIVNESDDDDDDDDDDGVSLHKPVRVSRAAVLKAAAENIEEEEIAEAAAAEAAAAEEISEQSKNVEENNNVITEDEAEVKKEGGILSGIIPRGPEVVDNTILGSTGAIKINPYLIRVNTEEKIIINKPVFKIGKASRGVDYHVEGNGAISRQHAVILHKGDTYFVKDNKSTNHTYVDGKELVGEEEAQLKNNSTIKLGDEEFTFKLS